MISWTEGDNRYGVDVSNVIAPTELTRSHSAIRTWFKVEGGKLYFGREYA